MEEEYFFCLKMDVKFDFYLASNLLRDVLLKHTELKETILDLHRKSKTQ